MIGEAAMPRTRLVELPGRGTTRVWECAGPRCAQTLMLIHGVTFTAELNWAKAFAPLGRHFRVVAADLRGHGDGIRAGSRFRLGGLRGRCRRAGVVHRLFSAGLALEMALGLMGDHPGAGKVQDAVGELDLAIRDVRNVVFDLRQPDPPS